MSSAETARRGAGEVTPMAAQKQLYIRHEPSKVGAEGRKDALGEAGFVAVEG